MLSGGQRLPLTDILATGIRGTFLWAWLMIICSLIWPEENMLHQVKIWWCQWEAPDIGLELDVNYELVVFGCH